MTEPTPVEPNVEPNVPAPEEPAAPEDKAPAESKSIPKAEHDAAMARLRIELKEAKAKAAKADEYEAAQMTALEKAEKAAADAEARATAAEERASKAALDALKASIGAEFSLPTSLRSRLSGSTEEELRADAEALAAELRPAEPPKPAGGGGKRPAADAPEDPNVAAFRKAALGS